MRFKSNKKMASWILCMMLIMAMASTAVGCNAKDNGGNQPQAEAQATVETENTVLGEGQTKFAFVVVDTDGNETNFEIHTNKATVGEALLELELIAGETSEYGLYVKTVNGITADYDVDQTYWAFYVNDEYAMSGADTTAIEEGATYSFKVEK